MCLASAYVCLFASGRVDGNEDSQKLVIGSSLKSWRSMSDGRSRRRLSVARDIELEGVAEEGGH